MSSQRMRWERDCSSLGVLVGVVDRGEGGGPVEGYLGGVGGLRRRGGGGGFVGHGEKGVWVWEGLGISGLMRRG